jgi:hypothetical protein
MKALNAALFGAVIAIPLSFLPDLPYLLAFGALLMIESILAFAFAWITYLRLDGVRFFQGIARSRGGTRWSDRIPRLGDSPPSPPPIPDADGPESESYRRLEQAELALKKRISEGYEEEPNNGLDKKNNAKKLALSSFLAGLFLLLLSLLFQYVLPIFLF